MHARIGVVVALVAALGVATGCGGTKMAPGGGAEPDTSVFTGSDSQGQVSFDVYGLRVGSHSPYVYGFRFASRCSKTGTAVTSHIPIGPGYAFAYRGGGVTITGSVPAKLIHNGSSTERTLRHASGIVVVRTSTCDSGTVRFTAES
jgi:hypothetical protein